MPMFWGDYFRDTQGLSCLQHGMYLQLIAHYWTHGSLPKRGKHRICKLTSAEWRRNCSAIAELFQQPGWGHKRIDFELEKARQLSEKRAIVGALSGHKNRGLNNAQRHLSKTNRVAIALQINAHTHKKDKKEVAEAVDNVDNSELEKAKQSIGSGELEAALRAKGWI
jgi:uncharacterized protein YdaU (DUF1376 family)